MNDKKPRVSIGLPVYNGECYLEEAIQSALQQTYSDFELILSDNASTDKTEEMGRAYAECDGRVRYYRNDKNLGASWNFSQTVRLASGDYFNWLSHDDRLAPDFLLKCVEVLDRDPSVVLCHTKFKIIDEEGNLRGPFDIDLKRAGSLKPQNRLGAILDTDLWCFDIFGLIRMSALKKTPLLASYIGSDRPLRAELSLLGRYQEVPEYLFYSRDHRERSTRKYPVHQMRAAWFDPSKARKAVFPHWRILGEYFKCVKRVPMKANERFYCYLHLIKWIGIRMNWAWMLTDLILAIVPGVWKFIFKFRKKDGWLTLEGKTS